MRDKLIGLALVVVVAGVIWYVAKHRATHDAPSGTDAAVATIVQPIADAEVAPTPSASIVDAGAEDAALQSTACRALADASQLKYEVAKSARWCIDFTVDQLGCKTASNGATWG